MNLRAPSGASAKIVNRVHRVVDAEARAQRAVRDKERSLWAPIAVCSALLLVALYAAWTMLGWYETSEFSVPDASDQIVLVVLWCLPVTIAALGFAMLRRRVGAESGS